MPRLFASMMRFSIWSLMPRPWRPPMRVGLEHQLDRVVERHAVERDRLAFLEADRDRLRLDRDVVAPERRRP